MQELYKHLVTVLLVSLTQVVPFSSPITSFAQSSVTRNNSSTDYHLPNNVVPISYKINLDPDFDGNDFKFHGVSDININIEKATNEITLHARNIDVDTDVNLNCDHGDNVTILNIEPVDKETDFLNIILGRELQAGTNCNLTLKYNGKCGEGYEGFYRTSHNAEDGEVKWIASIRPHLIGARQVFPCWDEPALKAKFTISVKHNKKYIALSNMALEKRESNSNEPERTVSYFHQSPKMSTYMISLIIGDFSMINNHDQEFRMWISQNTSHNANANYALQVGKNMMKAMGDYVDFSFKAHGLNKIDAILAPLPAGFSSIDHWGLVEYELNGLLLNEDSISTTKKEHIAKTIARELTNQWFGSLVTPSWYNYLWLSEGFASYFLYAMMDQIEPTWHMMDRFVLDNVLSQAFLWDSMTDSQAMEPEWKSPDYLRNTIDTSTYAKSGSIIRIISHILGEEQFKTALRNYVKTKAFGSVTSDDLFKELAKVNTDNNNNLLEILKNWVTVPGYPLITISRDYETGKAIITQSRFLYDNINTTSDKYWIPINFATEDNLNFNNTMITHWFNPSMKSLEINDLQNDKLIIFNKQVFGYYRINYDEKNWELITNYLKDHKHTDIHVLNRAQLIDDALQLARLGHIKYGVVLSLMQYLKEETDFIPWSVAWMGIEYMYNFVTNTEFDKAYRDYVVELSEKLVDEVLSVQLDKADHIMKLKRVDALKWACYFGSLSCRYEATKKLIKWLDDPEINTLLPDEKDWIICAGVQNADEKTWNRLWQKYLNDKNQKILSALGCTPNVTILTNFLSTAVAKDSKYDDLTQLFGIILENSENGTTVMLNFIIERYNEIIVLDGYSSDNLKSDLSYLGYKIRNRIQRYKLERFIEANKVSLNGIADDVLNNVDRILTKLDSEQSKEFRSFLRQKQ